MGITGSVPKDFSLLMLPSLILIFIFSIFKEQFYNPNTVWMIIMFFQLFEITHELSTIPRVLNKSSPNFKQNLKYFIIGSFAIIFFIGLIHYAGFIYFFATLIPLSIVHHIKQTTGILKWYFQINKRYCKTSIFLYLINYCTICFLALSEGSKHIPLGISINQEISSYVFYFLIFINISRFIFEINLFYKLKKIEINRILYLTHSMITSAVLILISKDYIWGYIFIIFDHCIHYLVISTQARLKLNYKYKINKYKQKILLSFICIVTIGFIINIFDFKLFYIYDYAHKSLNSHQYVNLSIHAFKGNLLLSIIIGLSFVPSFLHYFYDLFIWKRSYPEAAVVYMETKE